MSELEVEPMDGELARLIEAERERPGMPSVARDRLGERLGFALVGAGAAAVASAAVASSSASSSAAAAMRAPRLVSPSHAGWFGVTTFALGLVGGGVIHGIHDRNEAARIVERVAAPSVMPPPVVAAPVIVAEPAPVVAPAAPVVAPPAIEAKVEAAPHTHHMAGRRDVDLGTERALLEIARTALWRGQTVPSLAALERHAREFPKGRLAEERDSLWVQALAQSGRAREAKEHAEHFRRHYPHSLMLPAVDAALQSAP